MEFKRICQLGVAMSKLLSKVDELVPKPKTWLSSSLQKDCHGAQANGILVHMATPVQLV